MPASRQKSSAADESTATQQKPNGKAAPTGFGRVAKRISSWSANLLATALIVLVAMTFGRQVVEWWRADDPAAADKNHAAVVLGETSLGDDAQPHTLQFGELPIALRRTEFRGEKDEAFSRLRDSCRTVVARREPTLQPPSPSEVKMLDGTRKMRPVEQKAGAWQIFQLDGPLLMVVGVRQVGPASGEQVAAAERRVVCWGLGVPSAKSEWTLFTYWPSDGANVEVWPDFPDVGLPAGSRRTTFLRSQEGAAVVGFQGHGREEDWKRFFDQQFDRIGWTRAGDWQLEGGVWHVRFSAANGGHADVLLSYRDPLTMHGTINFAAPAKQVIDKESAEK